MLMAFFSWWYGEGWRRQGQLVTEQLTKLLDTFSFRLLLGTLFSPFRQISAGSVGGPLGVQIQAWFDRLVSRFIGAMVRTSTLIAGLVIIILSFVIGIIRIGLWPLAPVLPIVVASVWAMGWFLWM